MKRSVQTKRKKKLRRLYQEYKDLPATFVISVLGQAPDPQAESRKEEIRRRMEEIAGKPFYAVVRDVMENPDYRRDKAWELPKTEDIRAEIVEREMQEEAKEYALRRLIERRGERSYHSITTWAPDEGPTKEDYEEWSRHGGLTHEAEMEMIMRQSEEINRRRPDPGIPLQEKLNGAADKLRALH